MTQLPDKQLVEKWRPTLEEHFGVKLQPAAVHYLITKHIKHNKKFDPDLFTKSCRPYMTFTKFNTPPLDPQGETRLRRRQLVSCVGRYRILLPDEASFQWKGFAEFWKCQSNRQTSAATLEREYRLWWKEAVLDMMKEIIGSIEKLEADSRPGQENEWASLVTSIFHYEALLRLHILQPGSEYPFDVWYSPEEGWGISMRPTGLVALGELLTEARYEPAIVGREGQR